MLPIGFCVLDYRNRHGPQILEPFEILNAYAVREEHRHTAGPDLEGDVSLPAFLLTAKREGRLRLLIPRQGEFFSDVAQRVNGLHYEFVLLKRLNRVGNNTVLGSIKVGHEDTVEAPLVRFTEARPAG